MLVQNTCRYFSIYCPDPRHDAIWNARHVQPLSVFNATSAASTESAEFFNRYDRGLRAMPDLVTLVITSCNRPLLLQNTLRSFVKYESPMIFIPVDDTGRLPFEQVQYVSH